MNMKNSVSTTQLSLQVKQGNCNGYHSTSVYVNDVLVTVTDKSTALPKTLTLDIKMPCTVRIDVSGKNFDTDTIVEDNKIVQDKFTEITGATLAGLPIDFNLLQSICMYTEQGKSNANTFAHGNGCLEIELDMSDPIAWHLTHNSIITECEMRIR